MFLKGEMNKEQVLCNLKFLHPHNSSSLTAILDSFLLVKLRIPSSSIIHNHTELPSFQPKESKRAEKSQ